MPDLLLDIEVRFTPTYLAEFKRHEIPISVKTVRMLNHSRKHPEDARRRERVQSTDVIDFSTERELPLKRGDNLRIEGSFNAEKNAYDITAIHLLSPTRSPRDGRPMISQTYYPTEHRKDQTRLGINLDP